MNRAIACLCKPKVLVIHLQRGSQLIALAMAQQLSSSILFNAPVHSIAQEVLAAIEVA